MALAILLCFRCQPDAGGGMCVKLCNEFSYSGRTASNSITDLIIITHTHTHNRLTAFCMGLPG